MSPSGKIGTADVTLKEDVAPEDDHGASLVDAYNLSA